jgi:hypothetical protein
MFISAPANVNMPMQCSLNSDAPHEVIELIE